MQDVEILQAILRFFKQPTMVKFSKLCTKSLHGDTDWRSYVQMSENLSEGKLCIIYRTKKISAAYQTVTTAQFVPKICQGQPPTFGSHCSRFHPNRFTFGEL